LKLTTPATELDTAPMPSRFVENVSGYSTRVGAAQDLAKLDIDLAAITQASGWKSPRMPLQYAEKINVARSRMAWMQRSTSIST
jgi:hypothetical protein